MMKSNLFIKKVISIPKSLWVNLRYLPLNQALKFPICISYKTIFLCKGKIRISSKHVSFAMIRIGFHEVPICNKNDETKIQIEKGGSVEFEGSAHIGNGSKMYIAENAKLLLGDNFAISASSAINCYKEIQFGKNIQFSWNCLVMDSDTHFIYDNNGNRINEDKSILFGDKIWIGCNTTILKGTIIPSNCVIGAKSVVVGKNFRNNTIIAGIPAKCIKEIGGWKL